jgi:putative membrane protein insertion efficiency factor
MAQTIKLSFAAKVLLLAQRLYKVTLSLWIGQQCRYLPSCSDYAAQCVRQFGAWRGTWMGLARICRCRPGGGSGYDGVPMTCIETSAWTPWRYGHWTYKPTPTSPE